MRVGKVKWFDVKKGFGFVEDEDGGDVFVHYSVIEGKGFRSLVDDQLVEYEMQRGPKGLMATRVKPLPVDDKPKKPSARFLDDISGPSPDVPDLK